MRGNAKINLIKYRVTQTSSGSLLILLAVSALGILGLVFLAAVWAGSESDAAALDRQRQLVTGRLSDQVTRVSQEMQLIGAGYASFLVGDPSSASGDTRLAGEGSSPASAETFGRIATTVFGFNAAFLTNSKGELALTSDPEATRRFKWVRPLLQPLIIGLEKGLAQQDPLAASGRVGLMRLEGRPSVVGSIPVLRSSTAGVAKVEHLYLLVVRFLDGVTLDTLSREQGLAGARYARSADQDLTEVAFEINATATGEPIGFIIWKPDLPGSRVLGRLIPVLSVAGLMIAGLFFALMARLRRSLNELSDSEHHAKHLSLHDVLTGLPNRALFASRFEECLASMKADRSTAAIALIDLDKFKQVNDTYGHATGDELLLAVVTKISELINSSDTLARVGGDEFALLMPECGGDTDNHIAFCEKIIRALSDPFQLRGGDIVVRVGGSIGVTTFDDDIRTVDELLRRADVALYQAKTAGRARAVSYDHSMDSKVEAREALKRDLRIVLEGSSSASAESGGQDIDRGNLEVYFQGVYRSDQIGELSSAEALVRWNHPTHGLLTPDKFISIAEEAGIIDQLGEWVLREAAEAASNWPTEISIAVNVSPSQMRHPEFDRHVLEILAVTGLPPSRLELELTEATLFNINEDALAALTRLRAHGVRVALDDFGTGFSSLSHVIQFNIDRIKIDRSFVRLLGTRAEGAAIISAIVSLSRTLGKATTAEGVETQGHRDFLIAVGCTDLQGFLFSRPEPLDDFRSRISRQLKFAAQQ
ncbi:putative bifunctional diguanylate cyclase/phosphodiesterase [Rhizobium tumorigenes]|uniref:EAL domain-containing protein n=1 Tax=Rhizobium tumorigenes TaxID=2041385 RepID=A0AAF1KD89_9HYPH|nr:EAL domain-containing protein [Rhizobium tumorigenes]WFR97891.1 EAL domain-containing protein [Rhizobium tumorigenes]